MNDNRYRFSFKVYSSAWSLPCGSRVLLSSVVSPVFHMSVGFYTIDCFITSQLIAKLRLYSDSLLWHLLACIIMIALQLHERHPCRS